MAGKDIRWYIGALEKSGELARIQAKVDYSLELGHVAKLSEERSGPALLFETVGNYDISVLSSMYTSAKRMAIALGADEGSSLCELARFWATRTHHPVAPSYVASDAAEVYENTFEGDEADVLKHIPVPQLYPQDGGRFVGTAICVVTKDPSSGWVNVGTYRSQVLDGKTLALQPLKGKDADLHIQSARKLGLTRIPAAFVFGSDPLLFLTASTLFGRGICEYDMVGALREEPMVLTEGKYSGLPVPANAEVVIEGDLVLDDLKMEGPFGEYTGYYSGTPSPKVWLDVKRLSFRDGAVFPISTVGRPTTDIHYIQALNRAGTLWGELEDMRIDGIKSVYFLPEATGRFVVVVSVDQKYPGHAEQVGMAVLGSSTGHYGVKYVILVDGDIPADDLPRVWWAIATRSQADRCEIIKRGRSTALDPSLPINSRDITSKMVLNATLPWEWKDKPTLIELDPDMVEQVKSRWTELGLSNVVPL
ncbi:MAG: UbiD family decarboxylase [Actinomycetota bacterium]|jgi:4-hydroxy-3-polyprenylbenzoate decarboxylase|nr:UbiD family decarboxylase [Actinomycetota bacterium]